MGGKEMKIEEIQKLVMDFFEFIFINPTKFLS